MRISKVTFLIGIFIIISAAFTRQLMDFAKAGFGEKGFVILVGIIFVITGLLFLFYVIKNNFIQKKTLVFTLILLVGLALAWQIKITEVRIHILEYGVLGWFAGRDLIKKNSRVKGFISACIFTIFIGILEEGFQKLLPYRYFEMQDIKLNALGGIWGVVLHLLSQK